MALARDEISRQKTRRIFLLMLWFVIYLNLGGLMFSFVEHETELTLDDTWSILHHIVLSNSSENSSDQCWQTAKAAALDRCRSTASTATDTDTATAVTVTAASSTSTSNIKPLGEALDEARLKADGSLLLYQAHKCANASATSRTAHVKNGSWTFINAVYFCMTVISTIGYGHMTPRSTAGQLLCVVYALFGIPTTALLLAAISDLLAELMLVFYRRHWRRAVGKSRWSLVTFTLLYMLLGMLLLVFLPAFVFARLQNWHYSHSVYFAFVTISTIGFGDYVAAVGGDGAWMTLYKVCVMIWMLVGLGYWILVLNFLQKVIRSRQLAHTLEVTGSALRREAQEIRRALSESTLRGSAIAAATGQPHFVPERTKRAVNLLTNLSSILIAMGESDSDGESSSAVIRSTLGKHSVPGIHAMGETLTSSRMMALLMVASMAPEADTAATTTTTAAAAAAADDGDGDVGSRRETDHKDCVGEKLDHCQDRETKRVSV